MRFVKLSGGLTINLGMVAFYRELPEPAEEMTTLGPMPSADKTTGKTLVNVVVPGLVDPLELDAAQSADFLAAVASLGG